jgi:hypothetical protein
VRGYGRRGRWPDAGELIGLILLAIIGLWGAWFGVQSVLTLWWPINVIYLVAGMLVMAVSAAVARAMLVR